MRDELHIAGHTIAPGTMDRIGLPVGRLFTQQVIEVPLVAVHGSMPGPTIWVSAVIHGDEINGTEIVRRVVAELEPRRMHGTLLAIPVVNVFGFVQHTRYLPDRRDLNRFFPGSPGGSLASQIAHLFMSEVVRQCDYGIDLHAGSDHRTNVPHVRGDLDNPRVHELCAAFGTPIALHAPPARGTLRHAAAKAGIPCLLYEAGEPMRFDRAAIVSGVGGVLRVLHHVGMIEQAPVQDVGTLFSRRSRWMRASRAGVVHLQVELGDHVRPGHTVAFIRNIYGDVVGKLRAQRGGTVIACTRNPLVNRGDAVLHLAETD